MFKKIQTSYITIVKQGAISQGDMVIPQPPRLHLSAEMVDSAGAYLLDTGDVIYLYVGRNVHQVFLEQVLGSSSFQSLPEQMVRQKFLLHNRSKIKLKPLFDCSLSCPN